MNEISFGTFIKNLRREHKLTQQQLADMLNITQTPISRWENGEREISLTTMNRIARIFNLSYEDIIGMAGGADDADAEPVRILVLEDTDEKAGDTASAIKECMNTADVSGIKGFSSSDEVLDHCNANRVDMVFLDVMQKGRCMGFELAGKLKGIDSKIRVIILTDHPEYAARAWDLHSDNIIDGYIIKPLTEQRLNKELRLIRRILSE